MNFVKKEFRSRLTSINANACLAVAQDCHSVENFPYQVCFKS